MRISLTLENHTDAAVTLSADGWELVDADGFSVGGTALCERLIPADNVPIDRWEISPQTCVRTMVAFASGNAPAAMLIYSDGEIRLRSEMLLGLQGNGRREHLQGKVRLKIRGRGKVCVEECWSYRRADGRRRYIITAEK